MTPEEQDRLGARYTPAEMWQQPDLWPGTIDRTVVKLEAQGDRIASALADERARIILTGAGSSNFVGDCLAAAIGKATSRTTASIESTEIVAHPELLAGTGPLVLISFARSGESPESLGVYRLAKRVDPAALQIVITCNDQGALARAAASDDVPCLILDPRTNDRGLAMTSSFTNLALAGLGFAYLGREKEYREASTLLVQAGRRVLECAPQLAATLTAGGYERAAFLGSGALLGAARECGLKVLEMTDGRLPSIAQSFLGLRHGPLSFLRGRTVIFAFRSVDGYARRYESDLLHQLVAKGLSGSIVVLEPCPKADNDAWEHRIQPFGEGPALSNQWLPILAVLVGQTFALLASLACGCRPDEPSSTGFDPPGGRRSDSV